MALGVSRVSSPRVESLRDGRGHRSLEVPLRSSQRVSLSLHLHANLVPSSERRRDVHGPDPVHKLAKLRSISRNGVDPLDPIAERRRELQPLPPRDDLLERVTPAPVIDDVFSPRVENLGDGLRRQPLEVPLSAGHRVPHAPTLQPGIYPRVERPGRVHRLHAMQKLRNLQPGTLELVGPVTPRVERHRECQPHPPGRDPLNAHTSRRAVDGVLEPGGKRSR